LCTLTYNVNAFDLRVPSQYKHLRLTQRVTCLQKNPESFSAISSTKEQATHGNRNSEVV
jgi:hypothetical protein